MDFAITVANIHLIGLSFLFTNVYLTDLIIANLCALLFLNGDMSKVDRYSRSLFANGGITFLFGYPYFLTPYKTSGFYLFLLGILQMMFASSFQLKSILNEYKDMFAPQDILPPIVSNYSDESEESDDELEEKVHPTDDEAPETAPLPPSPPPHLEIPPLNVEELLEGEEAKED